MSRPLVTVATEVLVSPVDIALFSNRNKRASLCGLAPADSDAGTSCDSTSSSPAGNEELKNLMICTANSPMRTDDYFGKRFDKIFQRTRGEPRTRRKKALKAVTRKRLKVTHAIMRDIVPYGPARWEDAAPRGTAWRIRIRPWGRPHAAISARTDQRRLTARKWEPGRISRFKPI